MAAIVAMTLEGPAKPATTAERSTRDLRSRVSKVDLRRLTAALTAAPRGERPGHTDLVGARARIDPDTLAAPAPTAPEAPAPDTALLVAAPPLAPGTTDGPSPGGDGDAEPEVVDPDATAPWAIEEDDDPRRSATPGWAIDEDDDRPPTADLGEDDGVLGAPQPVGVASTATRRRTAPTAEPSPLRRSTRLLRGTLGLVLLLTVLGTLLAAVLAGAAAAVAIGVRAAIG